MLFGELLDEQHKAGRAEGEAQLLSLMKAMFEDNREADC